MNPAAELPLRDIHLPPPVSWWPPAPGWWILAGTVLLLAILLAVWLRSLWKRGEPRRAARRAIRALFDEYRRSGDHHLFLQQLSVLLRRIALTYDARAEVAGRVGIEWLELLDRPLAGSRYAGGFTRGAGAVIASGPYRRDQKPETDELETLCLAWINRLPKRAGK